MNPADHFVGYNEKVSISSDAERQTDTVKIYCLAGYLTVQNTDSTKAIGIILNASHKKTLH